MSDGTPEAWDSGISPEVIAAFGGTHHKFDAWLATRPDLAGRGTMIQLYEYAEYAADHPTDWPADGSTVPFGAIIDPVCAAIRFAYRTERQNPDADIPWFGLDIGSDEAACALRAAHVFQAENLKYVEEEQGRDTLTEIVAHAVRLGIEQGRRIAMTGTVYKTLKLQASIGEMLMKREQQP